jgi:hypothetical protein
MIDRSATKVEMGLLAMRDDRYISKRGGDGSSCNERWSIDQQQRWRWVFLQWEMIDRSATEVEMGILAVRNDRWSSNRGDKLVEVLQSFVLNMGVVGGESQQQRQQSNDTTPRDFLWWSSSKTGFKTRKLFP